MSPRTLAVIIGRAGSKGLPGKNALPLAGKPMIVHTIDDARASRTIDRVIVSTDGAAIARAAAEADTEVIDRPASLSSDTATVDDAVRHAVETTGDEAAMIVILYANVPVRPDDLIDRAVDMLITTGADSVQSYADVGKHHPWWMVTMDHQGHVQPHVANAVYRRQDLPRLLIPDGGVIAVSRQSLFTNEPGHPHAFLGADRRGIMSPAGSVIDVDTPMDAIVAESVLRGTAAANQAFRSQVAT